MCDYCWYNVQNKGYSYAWQLLVQCTEQGIL